MTSPMTLTARQSFLLATLVCLMGIGVLVKLGVWQVERLAWKNTLQTELNTAYAKGAKPKPLAEDDFLKTDKNILTRGHIPLTIDLGKSFLLHGRVEAGKAMLSVVAPATSKSLLKSVLVEVGCITKQENPIASRAPKNIDAIGLVRVSQWSYFTPDNNPAKNAWWRLDATDFQNYFRQPFYSTHMVLENSNVISKDLVPCPVERQLRNDHLQYAGFWFTMAGVLAIMWGLRFLKPYLQSA